MPRAKAASATVSGSADDVEAAFYEAMQSADIDKLMACWADEDDIVCVHPGGPRLVGAGAIRTSFAAMFVNGSIGAQPQQARKVQSLGSAVHSVVERLEIKAAEGVGEAWVIATNVYLKTAQGWRMVAHHASPGTLQEAREVLETPGLLH